VPFLKEDPVEVLPSPRQRDLNYYNKNIITTF
jgi:hypothetical protein